MQRNQTDQYNSVDRSQNINQFTDILLTNCPSSLYFVCMGVGAKSGAPISNSLIFTSSDAFRISKVGLGEPTVLRKWGPCYKMWVQWFLSVTTSLNLGLTEKSRKAAL